MTFSLWILRNKRRSRQITVINLLLASLSLLTLSCSSQGSTLDEVDDANSRTTVNNNNETEPETNSSAHYVREKNQNIVKNETDSEATSYCAENTKSEPKSANFILLFIPICIYSFLGITVTCHYYFVPSMSRISEDFRLSEDIVGGTFMAAGSSAPELATVLIAVFFTKNDIGISDVIGSAVFNMLFVIALCGLFATTALQLNWWPVVRNCFFYTVSILVMLLAIANKRVSWLESLLLVGTYVLYCVALYYNEFLEAWANTLPLPFNKMQNEDVKEMDAHYIPLEDRKMSTYAPTTERNSIVQSNGKVISSIQHTYQSNPKSDSGAEANEDSKPSLAPNAGLIEQLKCYFISPVYFICKLTIPDWQSSTIFKSYLLTFVVSLIWISIYSYIMVWTITVIGEILRIPSTVMGLTLVAAGVSVPDAVTSLKVVKEGYADMAVSNAVGSNIFDILICLGVPWFLRTALIGSGSEVTVCSKGMVYSTLMLLSTVILLVTAIHKNGWKLDRKIGTILVVGYIVFISAATIYELVGAGMAGDCCGA